jgi:cytochrome c peroxidase
MVALSGYYHHAMKRTLFQLTILLFLGGIACNNAETPEVPTKQPWDVSLPAHFGATVYDLERQPITKEGFELGRKLFYDPILSRDNTVSCGSCHIQYSAFTQHGHPVSHGIDNQLGRRNSLPIQNVLWQEHFLWDGGVRNLELVALNAISSSFEMDEDPANVLVKLQNDPDYPALFEKAYGTTEVSSSRFLQALAQFMGTLVSDNTKYDQIARNEAGVAYTPEEQRGLELVQQKCATCHSGPLFTDQTFRNNGTSKNLAIDKGRFEISLNPADEGKFRVPSLRNLTYTAPYMHNGSYLTLESVLDHYSSGVEDQPTLDPALKRADGTRGIALTATEKTDIIAFLKTLEDEAFLRNPAFSEQ